MALVYNCNDDVVAAAFISGLQVSHSFYKHLVKHKVTKMRDNLFRAQKYIQIEDATRGAINHSPKRGNEGEKLKLNFVPPKKNQDCGVGSVNKSTWDPAKASGEEADFTLFKISVDHVFNAVKNQEWVKRPKPLPPNRKRL